MKPAGKIGRWGRAAVVAALSAGFVLLAIPVANAGNDWDIVNRNEPATQQTVTKIKKPVTTFGNDWD
jgi:hypothetical protein